MGAVYAGGIGLSTDFGRKVAKDITGPEKAGFQASPERRGGGGHHAARLILIKPFLIVGRKERQSDDTPTQPHLSPFSGATVSRLRLC